MNYVNHYKKLVNRGSSRIRSKLYSERHRIIPGCMGGTYIPSNISYLSLEEHYVAHQLLTKIHPENLSLIRAAYMMGNARKGNKIYGWLRRKFIKSITGKNHPMYGILGINNPNFGKKHSAQTKLKMSNSAKNRDQTSYQGLKSEAHKLSLSLAKLGKPGNVCSDSTKQKLREQKLNKPRSEETKLKISISKIGSKSSEETKLKISIAHKGRPKPSNKKLITCPYCQKQGQQSGMNRWHFEYCKFKCS